MFLCRIYTFVCIFQFSYAYMSLIKIDNMFFLKYVRNAFIFHFYLLFKAKIYTKRLIEKMFVDKMETGSFNY